MVENFRYLHSITRSHQFAQTYSFLQSEVSYLATKYIQIIMICMTIFSTKDNNGPLSD